MTPILILKAFGHLPATDLIESERERERREWIDPPTGAVEVGILHRAFEARAEVMGWATYDMPPPHPPLWNMFEAGLVDSEDDPSLIGWVYVGLANPIDLSKMTPEMVEPGTGAGWASIRMPAGYNESTVALPVALPPFVQCLDDAMRRIGATDVSGYQLTCHHGNHPAQPTEPGASGLRDCMVLCSRTGCDATVDALVAFDRGFLGDHPTSELSCPELGAGVTSRSSST